MNDTIEVLDHGYVKLVESWGSDERIIEAARMSTAKGFEGWSATCIECGYAKGDDHEVACSRPEKWKPGDEKLLRYLYENKHATPFEFGGLVLEVQAPLFVFREWHRHRTQSFNEMSARYTPMPDLNYLPSKARLLRSGGANKQAGGTGAALTEAGAHRFQELLQRSYEETERVYRNSLEVGVPKELARLVIPVGRYSRMRAHACLRNWLAFLTLRMAPTAQWEIQEFARAVGVFVERAFPRTWALFIEGTAK